MALLKFRKIRSIYDLFSVVLEEYDVYASVNVIEKIRILVVKMLTTIQVNNDIKKKLILQSKKTGIKEVDLVNKYLLKGLTDDGVESYEMSLEEIDELLAHDNPSGETGLEDFIGSIDLGYETDSVELKKESYKR